MSHRVCYVVMCHSRPDAVLRLVRRIRELSPTADVLVRFDVDDLITDEQAAAAGASLLRSQIPVSWGAWSMVEAELEAFRVATERFDPDHVVLVSGTDYPVRDLAAWEREVAAQGDDAWVAMDEPADPTIGSHSWRVLRSRTFPGSLAAAAIHRGVLAVGRLSGRRLLVLVNTDAGIWCVGRRRPAGEARSFVKASQWVTLSRNAIQVLLDTQAQGGPLVDFLSTTRIPDEIFVPTVLSDDPRVSVRSRPTTHASFASGLPSPDPVDAQVIADAVAAGAAFVRKVDPDASAELIATADAAARSTTSTQGEVDRQA